MEMASKAIVSDFKLITLRVKYHEQWINANGFARIICKEYGVPEIEEFNGSYLVNVLCQDRQFKFANISFQGGNVSGVFCQEYSPEGASGWQYAYYITNEDYESQDESSTWYSNIVKVGHLCSTHCSVSSNNCQVLVTTLKQAREQCKQTKKKGQDKEKQDGDMNVIQSTVSKQASSSIVSPPVVFKHAVAELPTEPTEHLRKEVAHIDTN